MELLADGLHFTEGPGGARRRGCPRLGDPHGHDRAGRARRDGDARRDDGWRAERRRARARRHRCYVCDNGGFTWTELPDGLVVPGAALARGGNQPPTTGGSTRPSISRPAPCGWSTRSATDMGCGARTTSSSTPTAASGSPTAASAATATSTTAASTTRRPTAAEIREVVYPIMMANGVGLSPDGGRVYVAETGTARVWSWGIGGPGTVVQAKRTGHPRRRAADHAHALPAARLVRRRGQREPLPGDAQPSRDHGRLARGRDRRGRGRCRR